MHRLARSQSCAYVRKRVKNIIFFVAITIVAQFCSHSSPDYLRDEQLPPKADIDISTAKKLTLPQKLSLRQLPNDQDVVSSQKSRLGRTPHIFVIMIDTLREDRINPRHAPHLYEFAQNAIRFAHPISPATATHHANFGLYFSTPAYLREALLKQQLNTGAPALQVLKESGYQINLFADGWWWFCPRDDFTEMDGDAYFALLTFGSLLNNCPHRETEWKDTYIRDHRTAKSAIDTFGQVEYFNQPTMNIIVFTSPHTPYTWDPKATRLTPSLQDLGAKETTNPSDQQVTINSYDNAVFSVDQRFGEVLAGIPKMIRDSSLFFVYSDHGHRLFDSTIFVRSDRMTNGHGGWGYKSTSRVGLFYRFPAADHQRIAKEVTTQISSTMDFFPTLFDYLELDDEGRLGRSFWGKSIIGNPDQCVITTSPNGFSDPDRIVLTTEKYKAFIKMNRTDLYQVNAEVVNMTDANDAPLLNPALDLENLLRGEFKDCWQQMLVDPSVMQKYDEELQTGS